MKRSEMQLLISNKLNKIYGIVDGHWFFADSLLKDLESAGMLPPSDGSSNVTELTIAKYRWEPENEND